MQRKKVAILYNYNENWIGSTYYIQNLICALNTIPDEKKPSILIISKSKDEFDKLLKLVAYPYLHFRQLKLYERIINNFTPTYLWENFIGRLLWADYVDIDLIFPATLGVSFSFSKSRLFWVADFQEHFLPNFFSQKEVAARKLIQTRIIEQGRNIVLSSESARKDLNLIYPENRLRQFVLPFAVTHPSLPEGDSESLMIKYGIKKDYFICSNQFWKHKNHEVVLRAIDQLKRNGIEIFVVFTGKIHDYRNPFYYDELTNLVHNLDISSNVSFLGFISREDQLQLMKNSIAIIQPSLFEGWSTVVEDGKSLNVKIIASEIEVHKEQLQAYGQKYFFDPQNEAKLASCIQQATKDDKQVSYDYGKDILKYGTAFSDIITQI